MMTDSVGYSILQREVTLRDQFAMAALTGLLSDPGTKYNADRLAKNAYDIADAMLAERERVK